MDVFNMSDEEFGKVASEIENSQDEANPNDIEVTEPEVDVASEEQPESTEGEFDNEEEHELSPSHEEPSYQNDNGEEVTDSTIDRETTAETSDSATPDYKQFYEEITKPIKVNGVELTFNDPNEIRTLASKGTDYTRKTQEIAAQRRYIETLQNNGLLSDEQLNLLVGAAKGDKAALKQLIKQNNLNSDDLFGGYGGFGDDEEDDQDEQVNSYVEPENLYNFKATIKEISTQEGGNELLTNLRGWDAQSQNWVVENPAILNEMIAHKESGVYDKLNAEINRLKVLGQVPAEVPYLVLYKDLLTKTDPSMLEPQRPKAPIATGRGEPSGINRPNPTASRATTPRGSMGNKAPKKPIDVFSLSDEEFKAREKDILKLIGD